MQSLLRTVVNSLLIYLSQQDPLDEYPDTKKARYLGRCLLKQSELPEGTPYSIDCPEMIREAWEICSLY